MSFSGDSSDSEWKATKIKTEKIIKGDRKYYQQRFVERWLDRFKPWLARDTVDPEKPFCKACRCRLNCNKCHLQRHERTTKHYSNLQSYLVANGFVISKQNVGQRKERKKGGLKPSQDSDADESKFESVFMDVDYIDGKKERLDDSATQETLHDFQFIQADNDVDDHQAREAIPHLYEDNNSGSPVVRRPEKSSTPRRGGKKDRKKLLLQIQKDKNELMSSFNELFSSAVEQKEKNHVDLFFDSVCSTVKALTPKLIAETKMRVAQLIGELELRAITENESNVAGSSATSTVLVAAPIGGTYIIDPQTPHNGSNQVGSSQNDASYEVSED